MDQNNELTDAWMHFIANGDRDALSRVYFHYYDSLLTYGMKHTTDSQVVEDAIQSVFLNLITQRKGISKVRNLCSYLFTAFRHELIRNLKKKKRMMLSENTQHEHFDYFIIPDQAPSSEEHLDKMHLLAREYISKLPARQQEIIFLRFENLLSYDEISEMLNISVDSCYKSVYRSIKTIREKVEKMLGNKPGSPDSGNTK